MVKQWWLAELDQYGNPTLIDGAHADRSGAEKALTIITRLRLAGSSVFAIAEVWLTAPTGEHDPVNEEAIETINAARAATSTSPSGIRQTTPTEILKSEKGREAVEKTAYLGYEGTFLCRNCESAVSDPVDTREWCRGCLEAEG